MKCITIFAHTANVNMSVCLQATDARRRLCRVVIQKDGVRNRGVNKRLRPALASAGRFSAVDRFGCMHILSTGQLLMTALITSPF